MVKNVVITVQYAAIYSRRHRSTNNQNPSFYDNFGGFKGNHPLVTSIIPRIIYKIHIWK